MHEINVDTTCYGCEAEGSYFFFYFLPDTVIVTRVPFETIKFPKRWRAWLSYSDHIVHSSYTRLFEGGLYKPLPSSSDYVIDTRLEDVDLQWRKLLTTTFRVSKILYHKFTKTIIT